MGKKMLIDAAHPEETRVVIASGNRIEEFDFESAAKRQLRGSIFLAKVTRVEPSLQAAFVDYGGNRHGFLAFSEIHPDYYQIPVADREALLAAQAEEERRLAREQEDEDDNARRGRGGRRSGRRNEPRGGGGRRRGGRRNWRGRSRRSGDGLTIDSASAEGEARHDALFASPSEPLWRGDAVVSGYAFERGDGEGPQILERDISAFNAPLVGGDEDAPPLVTDAPIEDSAATLAFDADGWALPQDTRLIHHASLEPGSGDGRSLVQGPMSDSIFLTSTDEDEDDDEREDTDREDRPDDTGSGDRDTSDEERYEAASDDDEDEDDDEEDDDSDEDIEDVTFGDEEVIEATARSSSSDSDEAREAPSHADTSSGDDGDAQESDDTDDDRDGDDADDGDADDDDSEDGDAEDEDASSVQPLRMDSPPSISVDLGESEDESGTSARGGDEDDDEDARGARRRGRGGRRGRRGGTRARRSDRDDADDEDSRDRDASGEKGESLADRVPDEEEMEAKEARARKARLKTYRIQEVIKRRQIMLVQVVKEERGNKGAALTTYLSLAGRYCVLMPNTARGGGISRKITQPTDRKRLKEVAGSLEVPEGMGLIIRTAGAQRTKTEIKRDFEYLLRLWENVRDLTLRSSAPTPVYEEGDLIKRTIRDLYSKDIETVLVEGEEGYKQAKAFMRMLMPSHARNVQPYKDHIPLFQRYQVENHLDSMFSPKVELPSGGYLIINPTEALVSIDVNSGRATKEHSIEETALRTNMEAAEEVARQLRLRDLAGLIVIDFIDMEEMRNNKSVERKLKDALKTDRARIQVGRISGFGLLEMSRQRLRAGVLEGSTKTCPHCEGSGTIRSVESAALRVLRACEEEGVRGRTATLTVRVPPDVGVYVLNHKRRQLVDMHDRYGLNVVIETNAALYASSLELERTEALSSERQAEIADAAISMETAYRTNSAEQERSDALDIDFEVEVDEDSDEETADEADEKETARTEESEDDSRRRRGRRGGRGRRKSQDTGEDAEQADEQAAASDADETSEDDSGEKRASGEDGDQDEDGDKGRRRRRRGKRGGRRNRRTASERDGEDAQDSQDSRDHEASDTTQTASLDASSGDDDGDTDRPHEGANGHDVTSEASDKDVSHSDTAPEHTAAAEDDEVAEDTTPAPAPQPEDDDPNRPKRKGWWQRRFF